MNKREAIRPTKEQADERKRLRALIGQVLTFGVQEVSK